MAAADRTTERELVALLTLALAPVPVFWGFAPFESAGGVPSLPIVVVQRLVYSTAGYEDMCEASEYVGDTLLAIHAWTLGYEEGRTLADRVRAALVDAAGWRLQQEADTFEPTFRAWCIAGQWLAGGAPPT